MQKAFHVYERPLLFGGSLLRYAVACDGYTGANDFSTSWPVACCPFGNLRKGQLIEDRIRIQHIQRIFLFLRTMVHQVAHDRFRRIIQVKMRLSLLTHP
jgi:hypothetical protein